MGLGVLSLPAIVLFAPYKALTGMDLSTAAACAILAIAACASLIFLVQTLWKRFWKGTPRWFVVLACTAIIAASGLSYLVLVPWFYSIPILASLALAPAGIALWARSADDIGSVPRTGMVAVGSLLVALTMMCRPTFILTNNGTGTDNRRQAHHDVQTDIYSDSGLRSYLAMAANQVARNACRSVTTRDSSQSCGNRAVPSSRWRHDAVQRRPIWQSARFRYCL